MEFKKSENDRREFEYIKLENGMDVLLVSDKLTSKASASLAVNIGSHYDNIPGIAHFLEHLLFMGSEKYPGVNDYDQIVNTNNGSTNAVTWQTHTNYMFDCVPEGLYDVIDVFAQFFICPLFNQEYVQKEISAVHSEFTNNINEDEWRYEQCLKQFMVNDHPENKFTIGNKETLDIENIREKVIEFYNTYYSSDLMKLVVVGIESLSEMKKKICPIFENVKRIENVKLIKNMGYIFKKKSFGKIKTLKKQDKINFIWEYELSDEYDKYNLDNFITHLLGNESKNSLHNILYKDLFIKNLYTYTDYKYFHNRALCLEIDLTEKGSANIDYITNYVIKYIENIRKCDFDTLKDLYDDYRKIMDIKFKNYDILPSLKFAYNTANTWVKSKIINPEDLVYYHYRHDEYNEDLYDAIIYILSLMKLDNSSIFIRSNNLDSKDFIKEKYFEVEYKIGNFPQINGDYNITNFEIIKKNKYLVNDTVKVKYPDTNPIFIGKDNMNIWYKYDNISNNICLKFRITQLGKTIYDYLLVDLFFKIFDFTNNDIFYDMMIANCHISISNLYDGLSIYYYGLPNKINSIIAKVFTLINGLNENMEKIINKEMFSNAYDEIKLGIYNRKYDPLYSEVDIFLKNNIFKNNFTYSDLLRELENIKYEDLIEFNIFENGDIVLDGLIQGNILKDDAVKLVNLFDIFNLKYIKYNKQPDFKIIENNEFTEKIDNEDENNICYSIGINLDTMCYSFDKNYSQKIILMNILHKIISVAFFDELRTKEQLGYAIYSHIDMFHRYQKQKHYYYNYTVQSPDGEVINNKVINMDFIESRVKEFIAGFRNYLVNYPEEKINTTIQSVKQQLEKPFQNLQESFKFYMVSIIDGNNKFDFKKEQLEIANNTSRNDLIKFYDTYFGPNMKYYSIRLGK